MSCNCTECVNHTGRYFDGSHACARNARCGCSPARCALPIDTPLPVIPAEFASKAVLFDKFARCKQCRVKKYVNADSSLCLACHGFPP